MECAYLFLLWSLVPAAWPSLMNFALYVSNVLQLALLPVIMVGQVVQGQKLRAQADQDHEAIQATLREADEDHETIRAILRENSEMVRAVHGLVGDLHTDDVILARIDSAFKELKLVWRPAPETG
jgi:hypothetical protein